MFLLVESKLDAAAFEYLQIQGRGHFNYKVVLDAHTHTLLIGTNSIFYIQLTNFVAQNNFKIYDLWQDFLSCKRKMLSCETYSTFDKVKFNCLRGKGAE